MLTKSFFVSADSTERDQAKKTLAPKIDAVVSGFEGGEVKNVEVTGVNLRADGSGVGLVVITYEPSEKKAKK